jgi:hypothetical protein
MHHYSHVFFLARLYFLHAILSCWRGTVFAECAALEVLPVSNHYRTGLLPLGMLQSFSQKKKTLAMGQNTDIPYH